MSFLFAYLGTLNRPPGWPIHLIYATEAAFAIVAFVCILLAKPVRNTGSQTQRYLLAAAGGIGASFGLIMPFELAPFFFGAAGEWMLATILLNLVYIPGAALFIFLFAKLVGTDESPSDLGTQFLRATGCHDRGTAFLGGKDYDRAIANFTEAIGYNPQYAAAYYNRGFTYLEKNDYDRAIADYDQVIALNPKLAAAYSSRGQAYRAKGMIERANADFDQAHALMRDEEMRLHPEAKAERIGMMGVLDAWRSSRG